MNFGAQIEEVESYERCVRALNKAKRIEEKNLAHGHRYITLNDRTKVLVECDRKGRPTERGRRQLEAYGETMLNV